MSNLALVQTWSERFLTWLRRRLDTRLWFVYATIFLVAYALLFIASPAPDAPFFSSGDVNPSLQAMLDKTADLTYNPAEDHDIDSNEAKITYRLFMPILARLLNLNMYGMYAVQVIGGVLTVMFSVLNAARITGDRATAFLVGVIVIGVHAGIMGFVELRGLFDSVPLALLLMALYFDRPFAIGTLIFMAAWADERGLIASSLVFAFFLVRDECLLSWRILSIVLSWVLYFVVRIWFTVTYDMTTVGFSQAARLVIEQVNIYPMAFWSAFEGGWLLVLLAILGLVRAWRRVEFLVYVGGLMVVLMVSVAVADISRSTAYALPGLFVALCLLRRTEPPQSLANVTLASAALALMWAPYYAHHLSDIFLYFPFVLHALRFF